MIHQYIQLHYKIETCLYACKFNKKPNALTHILTINLLTYHAQCTSKQQIDLTTTWISMSLYFMNLIFFVSDNFGTDYGCFFLFKKNHMSSLLIKYANYKSVKEIGRINIQSQNFNYKNIIIKVFGRPNSFSTISNY